MSLALFSSYEYMRRSLIFYRNEIRKMTGKVCRGGVGWAGQPFLALFTVSMHPHRILWSSSASLRRPGSS